MTEPAPMMISHLDPALYDTDAFGHVNNTALPRWFEQARTRLFRIFCPSNEPKEWPLILVRTEFNFRAEIFYGSRVTIGTAVVAIGNSSFTVGHAVWQSGKLCSTGRAVLVHYDRASGSLPLTPQQTTRLKELYMSPEALEQPNPPSNP